MRGRPRAVFVGLLLSLVVMLAAGPAVALTPETEVTVGSNDTISLLEQAERAGGGRQPGRPGDPGRGGQ
jgi:hypothetical protein